MDRLTPGAPAEEGPEDGHKELAVCINRPGGSPAALADAARGAVAVGRRLRVLHVVDPARTRELRAKHPRLHLRDDSYVRSLAADLVASFPPLEVEAEVLYGDDPDAANGAFLDAHPETKLV